MGRNFGMDFTKCGIIPSDGVLIVRRKKEDKVEGIHMPNQDLGTEAEIVGIPNATCVYELGESVHIARTVGVPLNDDPNNDLWFVPIDDVLGWPPTKSGEKWRA